MGFCQSYEAEPEPERAPREHHKKSHHGHRHHHHKSSQKHQMEPGQFGRPAPAPARVRDEDNDDDDDMVYDIPPAGDPYAGEDIEMGPVPSPFPEDDMVYDSPVPPEEAYMSGGRRKHRKGGRAKIVPRPFGKPVPAPSQGGMMYDDPEDPYAGGYAGEPDVLFGEGVGESSAMGHAAAGVSGSWAGSTVPPASRPPRAMYVSNRHENLYHGDEFEEDEYDDPPGVAVSREQRRRPQTATGYTATSEYCNTVQYSRDYRKS